jgi:hypothetical protein
VDSTSADDPRSAFAAQTTTSFARCGARFLMRRAVAPQLRPSVVDTEPSQFFYRQEIE